MSGEPRYSRDRLRTDGRTGNYAEELTALREVLDGPKVSAPTMAAELYELERLVKRYPDHARRLVAQLPPPT